MENIKFEWDKNKDLMNQKKHKITDETVTLKEFKALHKEMQRLKISKKHLLQSLGLCTLEPAQRVRSICQTSKKFL